MSNPIVLRAPNGRRLRLAVALACALGSPLVAHSHEIGAGTRGRDPTPAIRVVPSYLHARSSATTAPTRSPSALSHDVTSCGDDANTPGTLRYEVQHAASGATIDLSTLVCSTITLGGPIQVLQQSLNFKGPTGGQSVTIDAAGNSEAFQHAGSGTIAFSNLTISNGYFQSATDPAGGCIWSKGNVYLYSSAVSHCTLSGTNAGVPTTGGGIYAAGDVTLIHSTITDSRAIAVAGSDAIGGGVFAFGDFTAWFSTLSGNLATGQQGSRGIGGGASASGNVDIYASTISTNRATFHGALVLAGSPPATASILDSTISDNTALSGGAGIHTQMPLTLANSTVAFNRAEAGFSVGGDGLYSDGAPLILMSSIIADNGGPLGQNDLSAAAGTSITGDHNVITSFPPALPLPLHTITLCPHLQQLADNGGPTRTHALMHTSPAIDQGDAGNLPYDQRGALRTIGAAADIGSVERQPGELDDRIFASGFDGLCDQ